MLHASTTVPDQTAFVHASPFPTCPSFPAHPQNMVMEVLHAATTVRAILVSGLSSGLRNDAPDHSLAMRQRWAWLFSSGFVLPVGAGNL